MQARTGLILSFALIIALFAMAASTFIMDAAASLFDSRCITSASAPVGEQAQCPAARLMIARDRASSGSSAYAAGEQ